MNKENLIPNVTYSSEDVGKALKLIVKRLNERKNEKIEISHICSTCKHRCTETYLTQDWMVEKFGTIGVILIKIHGNRIWAW